MSRAIALALHTFEVRGFEFRGFQQIRAAYVRLSSVNAEASAILAANEKLRSTARGWLL